MPAASFDRFCDQGAPIRESALTGETALARDLASIELWERSIARSRHRRHLREVGRRTRRRRKGISLAMSAALAGGSVFPQAVGVASAESGSGNVGEASGSATGQAGTFRALLQAGNQGPLVAAVQQRLNNVLPFSHLAVDGVYGPLTRGAVAAFQLRHGLGATGALDARTWATLFDAPVLVLGSARKGNGSASVSLRGGRAHRRQHAAWARRIGTHGRSSTAAGSGVPATGPGGGGLSQSSPPTTEPSTPTITAVLPSGGAPVSSGAAPTLHSAAPTQASTYVLAGGVALPLPRQYIVNGSVDQGVDYSAPGGTPEYAMGSGVIIGEGISGFGPNAPILKITSGPLTGLEVYYGHAGPDLVRVGEHVSAGQQITEVGDGIVGISTGPHLEIGFYPTGSMGSGSRMLSVIDSLLKEHPTGRVWGNNVIHARRDSTARASVSRTAEAPAPSGGAALTSAAAPASTSAQASAPAQPSASAQPSTPTATAAPSPTPTPAAGTPAPTAATAVGAPPSTPVTAPASTPAPATPQASPPTTATTSTPTSAPAPAPAAVPATATATATAPTPAAAPATTATTPTTTTATTPTTPATTTPTTTTATTPTTTTATTPTTTVTTTTAPTPAQTIPAGTTPTAPAS